MSPTLFKYVLLCIVVMSYNVCVFLNPRDLKERMRLGGFAT